MQILTVTQGYKQDPSRFLHLEDYASECGDFVLIPGGFGKISLGYLKGLSSKKLVRLEFEEPNKFFLGDYPQDYDKYFYRIFTICPYTASWLNRMYGVKKRVPIFFPVSDRYIFPKQEKNIDILYSGHIVSDELRGELLQLREFRYAFISNTKDDLVTHRSVSYQAKMQLYANSKITLVHNLIFKTYPHRYVNVWRAHGWRGNEAYKQVPPPWRFWELFTKNIYVPQLKSRVFEAAVSRSLILCRKDEFNIIERYFEPDREFVYYEKGRLSETVQHILHNYSDYSKIVQRAYNRAVKDYTVKAFVKKYLQNL